MQSAPGAVLNDQSASTALVAPRDVTVTDLEYRWKERALNVVAGVGEALKLPLTRRSTESVLNSARRKTGLSDWGDERFLEPLNKAIEVLGNPGYTPLGRVFIRGLLERGVTHRLLIEDFFKKHPEAADIPIERPVFVLGFPRTGTTLLQNLLSQAPDRRALQFWELLKPIPLLDDPVKDRAKRTAGVARDLWWAYRLVPEMEEVHAVRVDTSEECWPLIGNTNAVLNFDLVHGMKPFGDWLLQQDMVWVYREYRRMLQMLLWQQPAKRLVLKCPEHLWFVDAILEVFPDACIVQTHREPYDCVASYSSMVSLSRRTMQGRIDPSLIGPHIRDRFVQGVERAMTVRDKHEDSSFFDADFYDTVRDPVGTAQAIERHFGLGDTDEGQMEAWLDKKRADGRGKHRYEPRMWGLDQQDVHNRFGHYIDRFGVKLARPEADVPD